MFPRDAGLAWQWCGLWVGGIALGGTAAAAAAARRILSSRGESVEEHPWAGRDRRILAACCCAVVGAGRVGCVAARGVPAPPGVPRRGLPAGRLPGAAAGARGGTARRRAPGQRRGGGSGPRL